MIRTRFETLPLTILGTILSFDPKNTHLFARVSKTCCCVSRDISFISPYFQELRASLGQERLNLLFGRVTWELSRASLDELTQKVYQYVCTTSFGRELLKGIHGIQAASQLTRIVNLRDREVEEENANLVKIAPRLFNNLDALYAKIACVGKTEREILSLKAQAIHMAIADMPNRDQFEFLSLRDLGLTSIPKEVFLFTNLKGLQLNGNQLRTLPAEIGNLTKLEALNLNGNLITALPIQIIKLVNLKWLHLNGNLLLVFPAKIGNLMKLETLDLSGNPLTTLPKKIGNLVRFGKLYVRSR